MASGVGRGDPANGTVGTGAPTGLNNSGDPAVIVVMMRTISGSVALAIATLIGPPAAHAQVGPGVTESIVSRADPAERFAAFVPSSYRPDVPAPLVVIMDYRGRALLPLERLAPAAERLGYVLVSSWDSSSDETAQINERAVSAMIEDAQDLFTIDPRRLYFVGMSGTARQAWTFGERFRPYTAGVIGFGAALPSPGMLVELTLDGPFPFAFYGGAGYVDYNYEEVRSLDWRLDQYHAPHLVEFYPGPHLWPDSAVFERALEWLDVQAVRAGTQTRSEEELLGFYERRVERARALEDADDPEGAWRAYDALVADFDGLLDTETAREGVARVSESRALAEARRRLNREVAEYVAFDDRLAAWIQRVDASGRTQDVAGGVRELEIDRLLARAGRTSDVHAARAAQRKLEEVFVHASFYQPRKHMARDRYDLARAYFRIASRIKPDEPSVCLGLARTAAQTRRIDEALMALECVVEHGSLQPVDLDSDPLLKPLHDTERYRELRARLSG